LDIDLDDEISNSEQPTELVVSDFGNSAPNLAPKRKEPKTKKSKLVQKTKPITMESVNGQIEEYNVKQKKTKQPKVQVS